MIDAPTVNRLHQIIRRESLSVLAYTGQALPWTPFSRQSSLVELQLMVRTEQEAIRALAQYLARQRISLPALGAFSGHFTHINYTSLEKLLPRLIEYQRMSIDELDSDLPALPAGIAKTLVEKLLFLKREHLVRLEMSHAPDPTLG
jgi:hypothetical protein